MIKRIISFLMNKDPNQSLISKVGDYTFCSEEKLRSLVSICEYLNTSGIDGDFVECGTYKGGSAAILSSCLTPERRLWVYDSFKGMPVTTAKDGLHAKEYIGEGRVSVDVVHEALTIANANMDRVTIKEGWFEKTFKEPKAGSIALLHCDADWYESVLLTLETFYPLVQDGGAVVLDDFGYWEGCRVAFYEFCQAQGISPLVERVSSDQLYWVKNRTTNRV